MGGLVIVESPNKCEKIRKILGSGYEVISSVGHIMDLDKKKMGIDIETWTPQYVINKDKVDVVKKIKEAAKKHDNIYIATDADYEGHCISFNIKDVLPKGKNIYRVLFKTITKSDVLGGIQNPIPFDELAYNAQQARRMTDRVVGFKISPQMWQKGLRGTSAGRVQSSALKFIVDREREIIAFKEKEYWTITANTGLGFDAEFYGLNGKKRVPETKQEVEDILKDLTGELEVVDYQKKSRNRSPTPPFITSTLQKEAGTKFGWSSQKVMDTAQQLFAMGQITYHRCFPGYTKISTTDGLIPINQIKVGDKVNTINGPQEVTDVITTDNRKIQLLQTKHGYSIEGSTNEPLLVLDSDLNISWVSMENIKPGYFVALSPEKYLSWPEKLILSFEQKNDKITIPKVMTPNLASILGYIQSEGCISYTKEGKSPTIRFRNFNIDLLNDFSNKFLSVFNIKPHIHEIRGEARIGSKIIADFLHYLGIKKHVKSREKEIPWSIFQADKQSVVEFIRSYYDGDGSYSNIITGSKKMAKDFQILLLSLGIRTKLHIQQKSGWNNLPIYQIYINKEGINKLLSWTGGFKSFEKNEQIKKIFLDKNVKSNPEWNLKIPYTKKIGSYFRKKYLTRGKLKADENIQIKFSRLKENDTILYGNLYYHHINKKSFAVKNSGGNVEKLSFVDFINLCDLQIAEKLRKLCSTEFIWDEVIKNEFNGVEKTWDLTIKNGQHFIADGFLAHNTDSVIISQEAIDGLREKIKNNFSQQYLPKLPIYYTNKDGAQVGHPPIMPTYEPVPMTLSGDELKLLDLIKAKFMSSQMADAKFDQVSVRLEFKGKKNTYEFRAAGSVLQFDGFLKVYGSSTKDILLPALTLGQKIKIKKYNPAQHFTKPPARYTEPAFTEKMEKEGIGRPATYAATIETLLKRNYVIRESKALKPTEIGMIVCEYLEHYFNTLTSPTFTAQMETEVDDIASGKLKLEIVLQKFYDNLIETIKLAQMDKDTKLFKTEHNCPSCNNGSKMIKKISDSGVFLGCENHPKCGEIFVISDGKFVRNKTETGIPCPDCNSKLVEKESKWGKYLACSGYPNCKWTGKLDKDGNVITKKKAEVTDINCDKCKKGKMVKRHGSSGEFLGCQNYPKCKNTLTLDSNGNINKPKVTGKKCPKCKRNDLIEKSRKTDGKKFIACSGWPKCKYIEKE